MRPRAAFLLCTLAALACTGCTTVLRSAAELVPDAPQTTFVKNSPAPHGTGTLAAAVAQSRQCGGKNAHWKDVDKETVTLSCRLDAGSWLTLTWKVTGQDKERHAALQKVRISAPTETTFVSYAGGSSSAAAILEHLLAGKALLTDDFVRNQLPGA